MKCEIGSNECCKLICNQSINLPNVALLEFTTVERWCFKLGWIYFLICINIYNYFHATVFLRNISPKSGPISIISYNLLLKTLWPTTKEEIG